MTTSFVRLDGGYAYDPTDPLRLPWRPIEPAGNRGAGPHWAGVSEEVEQAIRECDHHRYLDLLVEHDLGRRLDRDRGEHGVLLQLGEDPGSTDYGRANIDHSYGTYREIASSHDRMIVLKDGQHGYRADDPRRAPWSCRGQQWRPLTSVDDAGHWLVRSRGAGGCQRWARLVAAHDLGRPLEPEEVVEHRTGIPDYPTDPTDCGRATLRIRRRPRRSRNPVTGVTCVMTRSGLRWRASITVEGRRRQLGTFGSPSEASAARRAAEDELA